MIGGSRCTADAIFGSLSGPFWGSGGGGGARGNCTYWALSLSGTFWGAFGVGGAGGRRRTFPSSAHTFGRRLPRVAGERPRLLLRAATGAEGVECGRAGARSVSRGSQSSTKATHQSAWGRGAAARSGAGMLTEFRRRRRRCCLLEPPARGSIPATTPTAAAAAAPPPQPLLSRYAATHTRTRGGEDGGEAPREGKRRSWGRGRRRGPAGGDRVGTGKRLRGVPGARVLRVPASVMHYWRPWLATAPPPPLARSLVLLSPSSDAPLPPSLLPSTFLALPSP